jgi:hypothetical protein
MSIQRKIVANCASSGGTLRDVNYERFLSLHWGFSECVLRHLEDTDTLILGCPEPGDCGVLPLHFDVDGTFCACKKGLVEKQHPVRPGAVHSRKVNFTHGDEGGLLMSSADRTAVREYLVDVKSDETVAPPDRQVLETENAELNALTAAFHIPPHAAQNPQAYKNVKEFLRNVSGTTTNDTLFMGGDAANVFSMCCALTRELVRPLSRAPELEGLFSRLVNETHYIGNIAESLYQAVWLTDNKGTLCSFLQVIAYMADRSARRPSVQCSLLESNEHCAACDPALNSFTYCAALRNFSTR